MPAHYLTRLAEAQAARDKEARIEHLTQMAARRMGKKELAMGFEGWAEMWQAKARQRNLLRQSGARLIKPRVVRAYSCWLQDWHAEAAARAAELAAVVSSQRIESEAARSRMAEAELVEVHSELRQAREALAEAGNDDELRRQVEEPLTI